jgi:hypothetical protein
MFSETDEATVARIAEDLLRLVNEPDVGVLMARDIANVGNNLQYVWPTHPQDRPYHARQLEEILDTNNPLKRQLPVAVRSALEGHLKTLLQLLPSAAPAAAAQEPIFSIDEAIEAAARLLGQFEEEAGIESPELRQGSLDFFHYQQSIEQGSANPDFLRSAEEAFQAAAQDVHTVYPQDHRLRFILEYISRDLIGYAFALINNVAVDVRTRHKTGTVDDALGSIGRAMGAVGGAGETSERARIVPLLHQGLAHICDALGAGQASDGMPTFNTDEEQRLRQAAEIVEDRLSRLVSPDAGPVEKQMNSPFAVRFLKRAS